MSIQVVSKQWEVVHWESDQEVAAKQGKARGSRQKKQCVEKMEDEKEVAHLTKEVPHLTLDNFHLDSQVEKTS